MVRVMIYYLQILNIHFFLRNVIIMLHITPVINVLIVIIILGKIYYVNRTEQKVKYKTTSH